MDRSVSGCSGPSARRRISRVSHVEQLGLRVLALRQIVDEPGCSSLAKVSGCSGPSTRRSDLHRLDVQPLGVLIFALEVIDDRQVVHGGQRVGMVGTQHAAADFQDLAVERLRLGRTCPARSTRWRDSFKEIQRSWILGPEYSSLCLHGLDKQSLGVGILSLYEGRVSKAAAVLSVFALAAPRTRRCNSSACSSCVRASAYRPRSRYV